MSLSAPFCHTFVLYKHVSAFYVIQFIEPSQSCLSFSDDLDDDEMRKTEFEKAELPYSSM